MDGGRKDKGALKVLRAVFRGLILDKHQRLKDKGEGDLLYMFYTTLTGDRKESVLDVEGRKAYRDVHGGGIAQFKTYFTIEAALLMNNINRAHSIKPSPDMIASGLNIIMIPLALFEESRNVLMD